MLPMDMETWPEYIDRGVSLLLTVKLVMPEAMLPSQSPLASAVSFQPQRLGLFLLHAQSPPPLSIARATCLQFVATSHEMRVRVRRC